MKQALTIMAVVMVALLAVSGFIVAGSMQQSEQLATKTTQLNDVKGKLNDLQKQYDLQTKEIEGLTKVLEKQKTELATLTETNENLSASLEEAQGQADEASTALAEQSKEAQTAQTTFSEERDTFVKENGELKAQVLSLGEQLTATEKERDEAQTELATLKENAEASAEANAKTAEEAQTAAANADVLQAKLTQAEEASAQSQLAVSALQEEMKAYMKAFDVRQAYLKGEATASESRAAVQEFENAYPESVLKLP